MQESLEELLEALHSEGQAESGGQFTVDFMSQARKMAQYQQNEPALFLLKAIQAAVASDATAIQIQLKVDQIRLHFVPNQTLENDFLHANHPPRWNAHLKVALEAALCQESVSMGLCSNGRLQFGKCTRATRRGIYFELRRSPQNWWSRLRPDTLLAELHSSLTRRCGLCPIPVYVDARALNSPQAQRIAQVGRPIFDPRNRPSWLARRIQLAETGPCFAHSPNLETGNSRTELEGAKHQRQDLAFTAESLGEIRKRLSDTVVHNLEAEPRAASRPCWFVRATVQRQDKAWLDGLPASMSVGRGTFDLPSLRTARVVALCSRGESGGLYYVHDGVLTNRAADCPGVLAVVAVDELETDLSQLQPRLGQRVEEDLAWMGQQGTEMLARSKK